MDSVGIIGFGRFGKILAGILSDDFAVKAHDPVSQPEQVGVTLVDWNTIVREKTLFVAVPIHAFKEVITRLAECVSAGTTIVDVCSVKVYPATVMQEHLPAEVGIIATHPLFGPDSIRNQSGLKMMMLAVRDIAGQFHIWKRYFESKAISVLEMSPEEHDRLAAKSQGVTHFIGRVIRSSGIKSTPLDTVGFSDLLAVVEQTCNDSWDLFLDLQNFNPYTLEMIQELEIAIQDIRGKILQRE